MRYRGTFLEKFPYWVKFYTKFCRSFPETFPKLVEKPFARFPLIVKLKENPFPAIALFFRDIIKENHWTVLNFQRLSYLESGDFRGYAGLSRTDLLPCHVCLRHRRDMVPILLWMDLCDWHLGFLYLPFSPPYWPHLLQREVLPRRRLEGGAAQSKSSRSRRKSETPALR